jgi:hypothetical protein
MAQVLLRSMWGAKNVQGGLVKVICAWCIRDGRRGFLREKAPLEDPRETHGLCDEHFREIHSNETTPSKRLLYRFIGRLLSALSIR